METVYADAQDEAKTKLLQEIVEALMWELDAVRANRWEDLPTLTVRKQKFLERLKQHDWTPAIRSQENLELAFLQSQIVDLEYQLGQMVESRKAVFEAQLEDLRHRTVRWRNVLSAYHIPV